MPNNKASLRKYFLQIRKAIPEPLAREACIAAADVFLSNINGFHIKLIAAYHPIKGEIDPIPLLKKLLSLNEKLPPEKHIKFALPAIVAENKPLSFHLWELGEELVYNPLYPQVAEVALRRDTVTPDVILVPLVAFDEHCQRIGYGGGFYDRTINRLKENHAALASSPVSKFAPLTIGYAYECQKSATPLPAEPHDIKLDCVITETRFYSAGNLKHPLFL